MSDVDVRRHGAEVRLPMLADRREFDRWSLEDMGITTLGEIEAFVKAVRGVGGDAETNIAVGRRHMWVVVPHPEGATG